MQVQVEESLETESVIISEQIKIVQENIEERVKEVEGGLQNNNEVVQTIEYKWRKTIQGYQGYLDKKIEEKKR